MSYVCDRCIRRRPLSGPNFDPPYWMDIPVGRGLVRLQYWCYECWLGWRKGEIDLRKIDDEVLAVLSRCHCYGRAVELPGQLDRTLYGKVKKIFEAMGCFWHRKEQKHFFPDGVEASEALGEIVTTGQYYDSKQELEFYETPEEVAEKLCNLAKIMPGMVVLEPSAGEGAIARVAMGYGADLVCVELDPGRANALRTMGIEVVHQEDFLTCELAPNFFDAVVMNPPFSKSKDIAHVRRAFDLLRPGGILAAVMSPGFTFREDRKAKEFRDWLEEFGGHWEPLPEGTFKSSGTDVRTVVVTVARPADAPLPRPTADEPPEYVLAAQVPAPRIEQLVAVAEDDEWTWD